jgi:hypothetical protein
VFTVIRYFFKQAPCWFDFTQKISHGLYGFVRK